MVNSRIILQSKFYVYLNKKKVTKQNMCMALITSKLGIIYNKKSQTRSYFIYL